MHNPWHIGGSPVDDYWDNVSDDVRSFYDWGDMPQGGSYRPDITFSGNRGSAYSGVNPSRYSDDKKYGAGFLYADVIRAQYRDYLDRYAPVENLLASEITATGTRSLPSDLARTRSSIEGQAANVQGQLQRGAGRYGLSNRGSVSGNEMVSAMVGGLNDTRARDEQRRQEILGGGLGAVRAGVQGQVRGAGG